MDIEKQNIKERILIEGMHCASCALLIEGNLKKIDGISSCNVNFLEKSAFIEYNPEVISLDKIIKKIESYGYKVSKTSLSEEIYIKKLKNKFILSLIFSIPLLYLSMGHHFGLRMPEFFHKYNSFIQFLLTLPILLIGYDFFKSGILNLLKTKKATMDTLISLGVSSAFLFSFFNTFFEKGDVYYEISGVLITIILLGRFIEEKAKGRTSDAIKKLMKLKVDRAKLIKEGIEIEIAYEEIKEGDILILRPGERIPVDGEVIEGLSFVDESMITGESVPKEKIKGENVIGGTINKNGILKIKAKRVGRDTVFFQILKLLEEAQGQKPPVQRIADKVASVFVPLVLVFAALAFTFWFIKTGNFGFSLKIFVSVLIISCPCALGLATPIAVKVGMGRGAREGILFKNATSLQNLKDMEVLLFDKTGTLTEGKLEILEILAFNGFEERDVLFLSFLLSNNSSHPFSEAISKMGKERGFEPIGLEEFEEIPGKGLKGIYEGKKILLGNENFLKENGVEVNFKKDEATLFLGIEDRFLGSITFRDKLKKEAKEVIRNLKKMGKEIYILTGDNEKIAKEVASDLEIENVFFKVLPEDKYKIVSNLKEKGKKVCFIGDGINDAPSLEAADIGIALGSGKDIALEAGDIILVKNDLRDILKAIKISHFTMKKIKQNLFWAFFYNLISIPVAGGILYPSFGILLNPLLAGLAMSFSSLSVVINSISFKSFIYQD